MLTSPITVCSHHDAACDTHIMEARGGARWRAVTMATMAVVVTMVVVVCVSACVCVCVCVCGGGCILIGLPIWQAEVATLLLLLLHNCTAMHCTTEHYTTLHYTAVLFELLINVAHTHGSAVCPQLTGSAATSTGSLSCTCTHACMHACARARVCVCMRVCACVCVCVCV